MTAGNDTQPPRKLGKLFLGRYVLDRDAEARRNPRLISLLLGDPRTRVLDLYGDQLPINFHEGSASARLRGPRSTDFDSLLLYLGRLGSTGYLAVVHRSGYADGPTASLRDVGAVLSDLDVELCTTALALGQWHRNHRQCPRCGGDTAVIQAGWVRQCTLDQSEHFPRTDPAMICAVIDADDRLLLAQGAHFEPPLMSVLAGFVEPGESLEAAVIREVGEEVGIEVTDVTYAGNQPWPFPSSLMLGFFATALSTRLTVQPSEILRARWYSRQELIPALDNGTLRLPSEVSIARALIESWYGERLPGYP